MKHKIKENYHCFIYENRWEKYNNHQVKHDNHDLKFNYETNKLYT